MNQVKVRIVGSKEFCVDLLKALRVMAKGNGWKCALEWTSYQTKKPAARGESAWIIYLTLWRQ